MKVTQELIDAFLFQDDEFSFVLHRVTGEVLLDAPESMTGEPEIDWDDTAGLFIGYNNVL